MDEAKTLVQHFLSALFGVLVLAAVVALLTVGNLLWRALSRQDDANRTLKEYAKYSAFDGTTVRGQDVIALLHDTQGDPFIVVVDNSYNPILTAFNGVTRQFSLNNYSHSDDLGSATLSTALSQNASVGSDRLDVFGSGAEHICYGSGNDTGITWNPSYAYVQQWFLDRGSIPANGGVAGYLEYDAYVLYDDGSSATITGFILREKGVATP